tara:strand:+ start:290 stop:460 length:171 start_codon:yes stop_codon:yes gene_type:complete
MEIKNAKYDAVDGNNVCVNATIDNIFISVPLDPANRHYAAILEWAKIDGNKIEEAD